MIFCKNFFILFFVLVSSLAAQIKDPSLELFPVSGNVMVSIGDAGNAPYDLNGMKLGQVLYEYQLGAYEQTVQDWCDFLRAVASQLNDQGLADPHQLYNPAMSSWIQQIQKSDGSYVYSVVKGKENFPITHVNLDSTFRKCNWHEHGSPILQQGENTDIITEHGAYDFGENGSVTFNQHATFYIPSYDEWIKAAYYQGHGLNSGFYLYPTGHNVAPLQSKIANYASYANNRANYDGASLSQVDACGGFDGCNHRAGTSSPYGCFDMGGNVNEWTSTPDGIGQYIVCGGSYASHENKELMINAAPEAVAPDVESGLVGFRIAKKVNDGNIAAPILRGNQNSDGPATQLASAKEVSANSRGAKPFPNILKGLFFVAGSFLASLSVYTYFCYSIPAGLFVADAVVFSPLLIGGLALIYLATCYTPHI